MPHQLHQGRQRQTGAYHIAAEGVAESVGISLGDLAEAPVMAKQRAETGWREGLAAVGAFEADEHRGGIADRALQPKLILQQPNVFRSKREQTLLVAFATHKQLCIPEAHVFQLQAQNLVRPQAIE
jgi:hypothetical protein